MSVSTAHIYLTRTPTGTWERRHVATPPKGVPVVRHWGELDLASRLYDHTGVCVPA